MTTNYLCNEVLSESDLVLFEEMKNPKRYQVAGLGNWGVVEGLVYENWKEQKLVLIIIEVKPVSSPRLALILVIQWTLQR